MDANHLLFYLRGFFENVAEPTEAQMNSLRNAVLQATPVEAKLIPVEVATVAKKPGDCGCKG